MTVKETNDQNFENDTNSGLTVIDFFATWCGPCKMQAPIMDQLSDEMSEVSFYKMDVDENPQTAAKFNIMSIPTLLIKQNGNVVETVIGYHPKEQLKNLLSKYIN